ncbi:MAG: response regulator [Ignavibacterium sp.]|nr:response regulator [Ignavibacterium sp.]
MVSFKCKNLFRCLSILIIISVNSALYTQSLRFNHITTTNGLSNNSVNDIIQDKTGFLWLATDDGLNRFDGYQFKVFRHSTDKNNSISDNSLLSLMLDSKDNIWIGSRSGWLNCYDPVKDYFTKWKIESDLIMENSITSLYEDSRRKIWIGTYRSGVYRLDPVSGQINHWENKSDDSTSLSQNYISSILEDDEGNIWIGTYYGLSKFNPSSEQYGFERFYRHSDLSNQVTDNIIWALSRSKYNPEKIWIGTANGLLCYNTYNKSFTEYLIPNPDNLQFGISAGSVIEELHLGELILWIDSYAGLNRLNLSNGETTRFLSDKNSPNSLASNQIHKMIKDKSGVFWFATNNGLSYFTSKSTRFNDLTYGSIKVHNYELIKKKNVNAIIKTTDNRLWFGTSEGLIFASNINEKLEFNKIIGSEKLNIWSLSHGISNDIWIGTYGAGLYRLDLLTGKLKSIPLFSSGLYPESVKYNKAVHCDNSGIVWIGYWGYGLIKFNSNSGEVKVWQNDHKNPNSLSHDDVWVIYQDSKGRIWAGTNGGGLNLYDAQNNKFYNWTADENDPNSLSGNNIYSICESSYSSKKIKNNNSAAEKNTVLWIGTNNGLNRFEVDERTSNDLSSLQTNIKHYSIKDGLSNNSIKSIVEDDDGNLWFGTSSGISFFNLSTNDFFNFNASDGVTGTVFNFSSALKDENGIVFLGSNEGINFFNPDDIDLSNFSPTVVLTEFQIFNQSVLVGDDSPLKKNIYHSKEIVLSHSQNVFSFQFAALEFASPEAIQYAYKMEGFDADWVNIGNRRFVTYTNLNPGDYIFKVKSTNSDGIWKDNFSLVKVIITPPWWQTIWAIGLYVVIFILGIWGIIRFQINRAKLQHELKMREFESHHIREVESMKSRFFANLSHEFRTPLTLIKGPLEQLLNGKVNKNTTGLYKMALRNTEKLQNLIDELLELSKLEIEKIPLNKEQHNIVYLLQSIAGTFNPLAEQKNILFVFKTELESLIINLDKDKLEKIINNLLSNAFKFAPAGGIVNIELKTESKEDTAFAKVIVTDNGIGIPEEHLTKVFNRFYQVEENVNKKVTGSGIGLALVKELVTLHQWDINVSSVPGKETSFALYIPLTKEELNSISYVKDELPDNYNEAVWEENNYDEGTESDKSLHNYDKPVVLFVDDSEDIRAYVTLLLQDDYNLLVADNAKNAMDLSVQNIPDLVLSDVMMPEIDGIELCNMLKSNSKTSHIPVILLTAKVTKESRLEGLESGADDYMTKPFNNEELAVRIKNLIEQRKNLREKFSKEINVQPAGLASNTLDEEFMKKIYERINQNLGNPNYDTDHLANELYISRRQLHRKLQALTGHTPGEFMRTLRMKQAAKMLLEKRFSITQIAYEVGFGSPAQFTRAFKKHFDCLPSEFNNRYTNLPDRKAH